MTEPPSALPTVQPGGPLGHPGVGLPAVRVGNRVGNAALRVAFTLLRAALCLQFQKEGSEVGRAGHRSRAGRVTAVRAGAGGGAGVASGAARTGGLWAFLRRLSRRSSTSARAI